ncbi:MAG TPA: hypothetical protein VL486_00095 [Verrucomicrobiae bacterium]|nr:hypothetical protein [Verrucomicrobiae bacterium]
MMKYALVVVMLAVMVGLLAGATSWADTNSFRVDIKGTVTSDAGKVKVDTASLLSTSGTELVLTAMGGPDVADFGSAAGDFYMEIDEVDVATTNVVNTLFTSFGSGQLGNAVKTFLFDYNDPDAFTAPVPAMNGYLFFQGNAKVKSDVLQGISGTLGGVWKVSTLDSTNDSTAFFKGTLKTKQGSLPIPVGFPVSFIR